MYLCVHVCVYYTDRGHTHTQSFSFHVPNTDGISLISSKGENMRTKGKDIGRGGQLQRMAIIKFVWKVHYTSHHTVTYVFLLILLKSIDIDI